jgi:hypothetical protein
LIERRLKSPTAAIGNLIGSSSLSLALRSRRLLLRFFICPLERQKWNFAFGIVWAATRWAKR